MHSTAAGSTSAYSTAAGSTSANSIPAGSATAASEDRSVFDVAMEKEDEEEDEEEEGVLMDTDDEDAYDNEATFCSINRLGDNQGNAVSTEHSVMYSPNLRTGFQTKKKNSSPGHHVKHHRKKRKTNQKRKTCQLTTPTNSYYNQFHLNLSDSESTSDVSKSDQDDEESDKDDDDIAENNDISENEINEGSEKDIELWDIDRVIPTDEDIVECRTGGCTYPAVAIWRSNKNPNDKWALCEDCQLEEYGGWPEKDEDNDATTASSATLATASVTTPSLLSKSTFASASATTASNDQCKLINIESHKMIIWYCM